MNTPARRAERCLCVPASPFRVWFYRRSQPTECMFKFKENCQTVLHNGKTFLNIIATMEKTRYTSTFSISFLHDCKCPFILPLQHKNTPFALQVCKTRVHYGQTDFVNIVAGPASHCIISVPGAPLRALEIRIKYVRRALCQQLAFRVYVPSSRSSCEKHAAIMQRCILSGWTLRSSSGLDSGRRFS